MSLVVVNPRFRRFLFSVGITNLGDGVSVLAFPWLATLLTRDPFLIAMVGAATRLPWLLLTLPAGVITDRLDRGRLMVRCDLFRLVVTLGVVALILTVPTDGSAPELASISALSTLAFLLGSAEVLRDNAAQTALPSIVEKDALERANGQLWTVEQVMNGFVGPPLAGVLIALAVPLPFLLDALTFGVAALLVSGIALPQRAPVERRSMRAEMAESWRWIRAHPVVLRLAVMLGILNAASMMTMTLIVLVSQDIFGLSAAAHGLILSAGAVGGVAGGLAGPRLIARLGAMPSLYLALILFCGTTAMIALAGNPVVVAAALCLETFAALMWNIVTVSYRQRLIPDDLLGRVNAIYRFFGWGGAPIGAVLGGLVMAWAEPHLGREMALRMTFGLGAAGMAAVLLYARARLRL